jgi:WD40 repeat protein
VNSAQFSPDGKRILTASDDKTARLWDAKTGKPIAELTGHEGEVSRAAFSPDGKRILTASRAIGISRSPGGKPTASVRHDNSIRLWDADTGKPIAELTGHDGQVSSAVFSPDGRRILTASRLLGTTARLWGIFASTQELMVHAKPEAPRCLTPTQRKDFFLDPEPPVWCIDMEKWPYHEPTWKAWLADARAGKKLPLPAAEPALPAGQE